MKRLTAPFTLMLIAVLAASAVFAGVACSDDGGNNSSNTSSDAPAATQPAANRDNSDEESPSLTTAVDFSDLYEEVRNSIVRITLGEEEDPFSGGQEGIGSGIVLDNDGRILTNFHVVRGFEEVTVTFANGTTAQAEVLGRDPGNDVAVIQVSLDDPSILEPATLGDSDAIRIGEVVAAIGNPFGLDGTLTSGIVSGLDRTLPSGNDGRPIRRLIQTDTAVNPGNSGGALFNAQGEVIGINTAIENPTGRTFAGIAYAVPINTPKRFMSQLIDGETIAHPRLGISGDTLTPAEAEDLGVPYGVAVISVESGSSADSAGLEAASNGDGDVIVEIDGQPMESFEDLADYVDSKAVGDTVTLLVHRDGEDIELQATLQEWDSSA